EGEERDIAAGVPEKRGQELTQTPQGGKGRGKEPQANEAQKKKKKKNKGLKRPLWWAAKKVNGKGRGQVNSEEAPPKETASEPEDPRAPVTISFHLPPAPSLEEKEPLLPPDQTDQPVSLDKSEAEKALTEKRNSWADATEDERGEIVGRLEEVHQDAEGVWYGMTVQGTNFSSLRAWRLAHPGPGNYLYVCYRDTPAEQRLRLGGVAYALKAKRINTINMDWGKNCEDTQNAPSGLPEVETEALQELARRAGAPPPPLPQEEKKENKKRESSSSSSSRRKKKSKRRGQQRLKTELLAVKKKLVVELMPVLQAAKRQRTLQQAFGNGGGGGAGAHPMMMMGIFLERQLMGEKRQPVVSLGLGQTQLHRLKKDDSSSSGETDSSGGDLATDHRLRVVARRLPGYLTRRAAKDASTLLAQSTVGEETTVFGIFRRYYRQVLQTKTSSRPMLREMATLRSALDKIVDGSILEVADLLSQRLKSLEMIASGSDPMVATEVELLTRELQGLASEAESRYAHKEFQAGVKLNRALKGEQGHDACLLNNDARPDDSRTEKKLSDLRQKLSYLKKESSQGTSMDGIFPIPLPPGKWTLGGEKHEEWGEGIIRSLNWLATGSFAVGKGVPTRWANVDESLPKAGVAGIVPAADLCTGGMRDFILDPERWLKPESQRAWIRPPRVMIPYEAGKPSLTELLQEEYLTMKVPRNEKKAVVNATAAEVQGAWIDGQSGVCSAKSSTVAKYLLGMLDVIQKRRASKKQLQMLAGGLVYLFSFRRCLMSCLNDIWKFIVGCQDDRKLALVRGELPDNDPEGGIVVISAFDGVGSLRLALDLLNAPVAGYIAIERNPQARCHFVFLILAPRMDPR
ncbi:unnamed protein product, partial [Cladocopium goreaui]